MAKARLQATIGLKGGAFRRGLQRIRSNVQRFSRNVIRPIANIGRAFTKMSIAGVAAAGAGIIALVKKTADFGDEVGKMAKRTGISVEELQRYRIAAELSGASIDGLERSVAAMSRFMLMANDNLSTATRALDRMGLSVEDLQGLTPEQLFETLLSAIARIPDAVERSGIALQVFGRNGRQLLPMLEGGADGLRELKAEADKLGIIMSADQVKEAEAFKDEVLRVKSTFGAIAREIGTKIMPPLRKLMEDMRGRLRPIIEKIGEIARVIVNAIRVLAGGGAEAEKVMGGFRKILEGIWTAVIKLAVGLLLKAMPILAKAFANIAVAVIKAGVKGMFGVETDTDDIQAVINKETAEAKKAFAGFGDEIDKVKEGFKDLQDATAALAKADEDAKTDALKRGRGEGGIVTPGDLPDIPEKPLPAVSELRSIGASILKGITPAQTKDEEKKIAENTKQTVKHLSAHERYLKLLSQNRGGVFGS